MPIVDLDDVIINVAARSCTQLDLNWTALEQVRCWAADAQNKVVAIDDLSIATTFDSGGDYLAFWDSSEGQAMKILISNILTSNSGSLVAPYDAGNGALVFADGLGITFTKDQTQGEYVFAIPDGVHLLCAIVVGSNADWSAGGDLHAQFAYQGTRLFNQDIINSWVPRFHAWEGAAAPAIDRNNTRQILSNIVQGVSLVSGGTLEVTYENMNTLIAGTPILMFSFT